MATAMTNLPDRDPLDVIQAIQKDTDRITELEREYQAAIVAWKEQKVRLLEADAGKEACKMELEIIRHRMMANMSVLRALPR